MNNKLLTIFTALALIMAGCADEALVSPQEKSAKTDGNIITVTAHIGAPQTRVAFTQNTETQQLETRWKEGDKIYYGILLGWEFIEKEPAIIKNISPDGKYAEFDIDLTGVHNADEDEILGSMLPFSMWDTGDIPAIGLITDNYFVPLDRLREVPRYFKATAKDISDGKDVTFQNPGVTLLIDVHNDGTTALSNTFRVKESATQQFILYTHMVAEGIVEDKEVKRDPENLKCYIPAGETVTLAANIFPSTTNIPVDIRIVMGQGTTEVTTPTGINRSVEEPFAAGNAYRLSSLIVTPYGNLKWGFSVDPNKLLGMWNWVKSEKREESGWVTNPDPTAQYHGYWYYFKNATTLLDNIPMEWAYNLTENRLSIESGRKYIIAFPDDDNLILEQTNGIYREHYTRSPIPEEIDRTKLIKVWAYEKVQVPNETGVWTVDNTIDLGNPWFEFFDGSTGESHHGTFTYTLDWNFLNLKYDSNSGNSYRVVEATDDLLVLESIDVMNGKMMRIHFKHIPSMTLTTARTAGETINLSIRADQADQAGVWIDLNNNGKKDDGEAVTQFNVPADYTLAAQTVTLYGKVTHLHCNNNNLTELNISNNMALKQLYCRDNKLTALYVDNNTLLTHLNCSGNNNLSSLNVSKNTALKNLNCSGNNNLSSLNVSKNTALKELYCQNNKLTELYVDNNTLLTYLDCSGNNLSSLNVSKNTALTGLNCSDNNLSVLDVIKNTALERLHCSSNKISGTNMTILVNSLPDRNGETQAGDFRVINPFNPNEENVCTQAQVKKATDKNWNVKNSNGKPYPGS